MTVALQVLMSEIEKIAPKFLAEDWDNVGLLIGSPSQGISRALVTLDCTPEVVQEGISKKVDVIIAHHPLMFKPIKQIRYDLPGQDLVASMIQNKIMLYAAHTNLDSCPLGGTALLADCLKLTEQEFIMPGYRDQILKLVVFVPEEHVDKVRESITKAGAGGMGDYTECSFQTSGTGMFRPQPGANPFVGTVGSLESVQEVRLETIAPARSIERVIRAMLKAHPYESPAYDIIPTLNKGMEYGLGLVGYLPSEVTLAQLVKDVKELLRVCSLRVAGNLETRIKKVAICTGSGGSVVKNAAFKGAGVLIAGDISHHDALDALAAGMAIIDPGHFATEWYMMEKLTGYLQGVMQREKRSVEIILSEIKTEPFAYM